jgi:hypothetical protein
MAKIKLYWCPSLLFVVEYRKCRGARGRREIDHFKKFGVRQNEKVFLRENICDESEGKAQQSAFGECISTFIIELAFCQAVFYAYLLRTISFLLKFFMVGIKAKRSVN